MTLGPHCLWTFGEANHNRHAKERATVHLMVATKKANIEEESGVLIFLPKAHPNYLTLIPESRLPPNSAED